MKGLVLAGGGAKGSYQVGVYEALQELNWQPDIITGASVGCLNGAMFVLDKSPIARDMWLTVTNEHVMTPPQKGTGTELSTFLENIVKNGGMDISPLEEIVLRVVDEEAMRASRIGYGLTTVSKRSMRPKELTLQEIAPGKLIDYMLASAACFPAFRPRNIDGEDFIDGGYGDNMPLALAARMGAEELIAVDVDGIGITRPNLTGRPTRLIRCHWDLGSILTFDPVVARHNIQLGYQDCYRSFGKLLGTAYALKPDTYRDLLSGFVRPYARLMKELLHRHPTLALTERAALLPMEGLFNHDSDNAPIAPLEQACKQVGVEPACIYTAEQLFDTFLQQVDLEQCAQFAPLWEGSEGLHVKELALASAQPAEFLVAAVAAALQIGQTRP